MKMKFEGSKIALNLFNGSLDAGPYLVIFSMYVLAVVSILSLIFADVYVGQITQLHLSSDTKFSWFISLATTGFLIIATAIVIKGFDKHWNPVLVWTLAIATLSVISADIYFDAMAADVTRFGSFVYVKDVLPGAEGIGHHVFRFLVGALSALGEPLAGSAIAVFPLLKEFLDSLVGTVSNRKVNTQPAYSVPKPFTKPAYPYPSTQNRTAVQSQFSSRLPQGKAQGDSKPAPTYHPVTSPAERGDRSY